VKEGNSQDTVEWLVAWCLDTERRNLFFCELNLNQRCMT